jgi:feruloyl esterase
MRLVRAFGCAAVIAAVAHAPLSGAGRSCEALASLALPQTTITAVKPVAAGGFVPPGAGGRSDRGDERSAGVLSHCRDARADQRFRHQDRSVAAGLRLERQVPRRRQRRWAGSISYAAMADALRHGYATSSTDTGHSTPGASFALGHPEKLIDYAWRSEHEMTVKAKAIIAAHYGETPKLSYWNGCSAGGKQA